MFARDRPQSSSRRSPLNEDRRCRAGVQAQLLPGHRGCRRRPDHWSLGRPPRRLGRDRPRLRCRRVRDHVSSRRSNRRRLMRVTRRLEPGPLPPPAVLGLQHPQPANRRRRPNTPHCLPAPPPHLADSPRARESLEPVRRRGHPPKAPCRRPRCPPAPPLPSPWLRVPHRPVPRRPW